MTSEIFEKLEEKFKNRNLLTELAYCRDHIKNGYITGPESEFYKWLFYKSHKIITEDLIEMRLKELEKEPKEGSSGFKTSKNGQNRNNKTKTDCISRQAAIDAIAELFGVSKAYAWQCLCGIPSERD